MKEHGQPFIVAVDFDGTLVEHRFPAIGNQVEGAFLWLHRFVGHGGARLILWTMRSVGDTGDVLTPAIEFCRGRGVEFWGINENPHQTSTRWSTSPKVYAHAYIDDAAAGTPLIHSPHELHRPYVNWGLVGPNVMQLIRLHNQLNNIRIDTTELNEGNNVWSDRLSLPPTVELPVKAIIKP